MVSHRSIISNGATQQIHWRITSPTLFSTRQAAKHRHYLAAHAAWWLQRMRHASAATEQMPIVPLQLIPLIFNVHLGSTVFCCCCCRFAMFNRASHCRAAGADRVPCTRVSTNRDNDIIRISRHATGPQLMTEP